MSHIRKSCELHPSFVGAATLEYDEALLGQYLFLYR